MMDTETKLNIIRQWSEECEVIAIEGKNLHRIVINYPTKSKLYTGPPLQFRCDTSWHFTNIGAIDASYKIVESIVLGIIEEIEANV